MSFEINSKKFQIILFSLVFTLVIFTINKSSNLSSNSFQKLSFIFRDLLSEDDVDKRCDNTRKGFLDNYKIDYHSNLKYDEELTKYQKVLKDIIENRDDYAKDAKTYLPRILIFLIFILVDIFLILVWIIFCCCCCCSNNKKSSSSICGKCSFVIYLILSCVVILLCVLGFFLSPSFLKSINGVACSFYKLIFHFIDGTENDFPPSKWKGIKGLQDLIEKYANTYTEIPKLKDKSDLTTDCNSEDEYCIFYDNIVQNIKKENRNADFQNSLENIKGDIDKISETFNSIKNEALEDVEKIMKEFDKQCNLDLMALFCAIFLFSFLSLITLIIYFTCNCQCISCLYHLFWNFEMIMIISTLLIGSVLGIVGVVSKDAISILKYVKSSKNLISDEPFLLKIDSNIKEKIDICFNKDGILMNNDFQGSFNSDIDKYYDSFEGNYSDFKNQNDFTEKKDLVKAFEELDEVLKNLKNLNDYLKKGNLENLLNCKFVGSDFDILVDELNNSLVKKLLLYSFIIIIADLASVISIFFGIQVIKNYKGQSEPQQIETSEKRTKSRSKDTKNNMDSSSDNLRK